MILKIIFPTLHAFLDDLAKEEDTNLSAIQLVVVIALLLLLKIHSFLSPSLLTCGPNGSWMALSLTIKVGISLSRRQVSLKSDPQSLPFTQKNKTRA